MTMAQRSGSWKTKVFAITCGYAPKGKGEPVVIGSSECLKFEERRAVLLERCSGPSESSWDYVCFERGGTLTGPVRYVDADYRTMLREALLVFINVFWTSLVILLIAGGLINFFSAMVAGLHARLFAPEYAVQLALALGGLSLLFSLREWMRFCSERRQIIQFETPVLR